MINFGLPYRVPHTVSFPPPPPPGTHRVVDAFDRDSALRVADSAADHHLVQIEHQPHQHLDHHRHEQVPVDLGAVILQRPAEGDEGGGVNRWSREQERVERLQSSCLTNHNGDMGLINTGMKSLIIL